MTLEQRRKLIEALKGLSMEEVMAVLSEIYNKQEKAKKKNGNNFQKG